MARKTFWATILLVLLMAAAIWAGPKIKGAETISSAEDLNAIVVELLDDELSQEEVEHVLEHLDAIEEWAEAHPDVWRKAALAETREEIDQLLELEVWKSAGISGNEFLAFLVKIQLAIAMMEGDLDVDELNEELTILNEIAIEVADVDQDTMEELVLDIADLEELLEKLEAYPEENLDIVDANREEIDDFLARLSRLEGEAPEEDTTPTDDSNDD